MTYLISDFHTDILLFRFIATSIVQESYKVNKMLQEIC